MKLSFEDFCAQRLRIQNKRGEIVSLRLNRTQRTLMENLTGRDIVLKARQLGISTAIQALHFQEHMQGNVRTNTLCHDDELTTTMRQMSELYYSELPGHLRPHRQIANAKKTVFDELYSESSIATVGGTVGKRKGRGGSMTRIHGSEVAYWPDAQGVMSAAMQAGNPEIVLESTPNGTTGWFYEQCMAALDGDSVWTLHFFAWWWDDEYRIALEPGEALTFTTAEAALVDEHDLDVEQIKWRRQKIKELPHTFKQEYPEDPYSCFLASGKSFFGDVEHVFTAPADAQPIVEDLEAYPPIDAHRYVGGLDFGQTNDYTVMPIIDSTTNTQVDLLRIRNEAWQEMRRQISIMANKWDADITGESNSMGTTNIELLQSGELLEDGERIEPIKLTSFDNTATSKAPLIQGLHYALHEAGLTLLPDAAQKHELRAFISKQLPSGHWQYMGGDGAHDDTVIGLALAWRGAQRSGSLISWI